MTFRNGETLYTQTGNTVAFDHDLNGTAYVHPILTVTRQVSNSRGDDFEEYDEEVLADHLIAVPYNTLTRAKPIDLLDTQIAEKQAKLSELNQQITRAESDARSAVRTCERLLADKQKELADWIDQYPLFAEAAAFLAGEQVYALSIYENSHTRHPHLPSITKDEDLRLIRMRPKTARANQFARKKGTEHDRLEWVAVTKNGYSEPREVTQLFFGSDAERSYHVRELFDKVCTAFRAHPKFSNGTYSHDLDMGLLRQWTARFTFLTIPYDILQMETAHHAEAKEQQRARLQQQLEALGGAE